METLLVLLIVLATAFAFGELIARLGQPSMVGLLLAGMALGVAAPHLSAVWPAVGGLAQDPFFKAAVDLSIFFLMLMAGLELRPSEIVEVTSRSVFVAMGGMALPLLLGLAIGWLYLPESTVKTTQVLFLGTALAITAVPVTVKLLMDLGQLHTRFGEIIVSAAITDDVIALFLLALLTAMIGSNTLPPLGGVILLVGQVLLFFLVVILAGRYAFPAIGHRLHQLRLAEPEASFVLLAACSFAVLAEVLGMHFILGAFAAGLFFGPSTVGQEAYDSVKARISSLTTSLFAPVFFVSIGFRADFSALIQVPDFTLLLVAAAILGKFAGAGLPAWLSGLSRAEAAAVGAGMSGRGAVELVVADVALRAGLFSMPTPPPPIVANLFSAVVFMAIATTLFAPIALRRILLHSDLR